MAWPYIEGWSDPWAPGDLPLARAWQVCPDGRWMIAAAVHAGLPVPRVVGALAACVRQLVPEPDGERWAEVLDAAVRYGEGDDEAERELERSLPSASAGQRRPQPRPDRHGAVGLLIASSLLGSIATAAACDALRPSTPPDQRARRGAELLRALAGVAAFESIRLCHADAERTVHALRSTGEPAADVPSAGRDAWDEVAARAFAHALEGCAERLRSDLPAPFAETVN